MKKKSAKFVKKVASFRNNEKGTASIEFAMILPLMIATYFGTVEVSKLYITKNKVESVAETISDLVAQGTTITKNDLDDIFSIGTNSLTLEENLKFNLVVTAVETQPDDDGNPVSRVIWSESKKKDKDGDGVNTKSIGDTITDMPEGLARNFETIIITELFYKHTAINEYFIKGPKSFDRRFYSKPRYTASIPCSDCT